MPDSLPATRQHGRRLPRLDMSTIIRALVDVFGPRCPELQPIGAEPPEIPSAGQTDALDAGEGATYFSTESETMRRLHYLPTIAALKWPPTSRLC